MGLATAKPCKISTKTNVSSSVFLNETTAKFNKMYREPLWNKLSIHPTLFIRLYLIKIFQSGLLELTENRPSVEKTENETRMYKASTIGE